MRSSVIVTWSQCWSGRCAPARPCFGPCSNRHPLTKRRLPLPQCKLLQSGPSRQGPTSGLLQSRTVPGTYTISCLALVIWGYRVAQDKARGNFQIIETRLCLCPTVQGVVFRATTTPRGLAVGGHRGLRCTRRLVGGAKGHRAIPQLSSSSAGPSVWKTRPSLPSPSAHRQEPGGDHQQGPSSIGPAALFPSGAYGTPA